MRALIFALLAVACSPIEPDMPVFDDVDGDGYTTEDGDCVDLDPTAYPGAEEICDGVDNDCDGDVDEGLGSTWYRDGDGDDHGLLDYPREACSQPAGHSAQSDDCDDAEATIHPGADERCNGVDDDCDGDIDEDGAVDSPEWFVDADGDGFGDATTGSTHCDAPAGTVSNDDDCDDTDATIYPGAPEITPGVDNDCNGSVDNTIPVAVPLVTSEPPIKTCDVVALDGTGSWDPDGDTIRDYDWTLDVAPTASTLTTDDLDTPDDAQPTFVPDVAGAYTFGLVVQDQDDDSLKDTVDLEVEQRSFNGTPIADAGLDQAAEGTTECSETSYGYSCTDCTEVPIVLDGTGSTDPNGDYLRYSWTSDSSYATIVSDDEETAYLYISGVEGEMETVVTETITVTLELTDCMLASHSDTMTIVYTCQEEAAPEER